VTGSGKERLVPGLVIDAMRREDLREILAIEIGSFSTPWTEDMFTNELAGGASGVTLVARAPEAGAPAAVVGYACVWVVSDELHINNLAVHPRWRRRGIARALVRSSLEHGTRLGARVAFLEVRASNVAAQRLYREFDFEQVGFRRGYYTHPMEDALIMRRTRLGALDVEQRVTER
jgi:ribosomal-protein-alanine N-acetyltransferase